MVINRINKMTVKSLPTPRQGAIESSSLDIDLPHLAPLFQSLAPPSRGGTRGSGSSSSSDDEGDNFSGNITDPTKDPSKKCSKKARYIYAFELYGTFCFFFFIGTCALWLHTHFSKLRYFIAEPDTARFFSIETGSTWRIFKFLVGSIIHCLVVILTVILIVGLQSLRKSILRYQEKILLWLSILAVIGEYFMVNATVDYVISRPTVENGYFNHTILVPPPPKDLPENCTNKKYIRSNPGAHDDNEKTFTRVNLKWFTEVLCHHHHGSEHTLWEEKMKKSFTHYSKENSGLCQHYERKKKLMDSASEDCHQAKMLQLTCYLWCIISFMGIFFCMAMFNLYGKMTLKTKPFVRLAFVRHRGEDKSKTSTNADSQVESERRLHAMIPSTTTVQSKHKLHKQPLQRVARKSEKDTPQN